MSKRADDFQKQAEKYADDVWKEDADIEQKCITMTDYFAGAEYGYQYAVESVLAKVYKNYIQRLLPTMSNQKYLLNKSVKQCNDYDGLRNH